jgi:predicted Zn-dependent peptidase
VSITENKEITTTRESGVSYLIVAFPAPPASGSDLAAMKVLNAIVGGGMSSRLFVELRDNQGLAYSTGSSLSTRAGDSAFVTYIIALPENAEKGYQGILQVLDDIRSNGVTDEELDRGKNKELGTFLLNQETADSRALDVGLNTVIGTGVEYDEQYPELIRAVTKQDVQRVAEKYLQSYVVSRLDPPQE